MLMHDMAFPIDHDSGWQPTEFPQLDLLAVQLGDHMVLIRQAGERIALAFPLLAERIGAVRARDKDLRVVLLEFGVSLAQLRQMPAAVRS